MEPDPEVLEMVRRQLDRDPPPSTEALYGRAARINDQIYGLSLRQFNATYVLRVKRERKRAERERASSSADSSTGTGDDGGRDGGEPVEPRSGGFLDAVREAESDEEPPDEEDEEDRDGRAAVARPLRDRIRSVLWRYAREVAGAAGMTGAVAAVEEVDERVDEIVEIAGLATDRPAAD